MCESRSESTPKVSDREKQAGSNSGQAYTFPVAADEDSAKTGCSALCNDRHVEQRQMDFRDGNQSIGNKFCLK